MKNIVLIGMMGSGKTTLGKMLSKALKKGFVDLDQYIEDGEDMSISDIFEKYGEDHFRKLEIAYAKDLSKRKNIVIATGGGIIKSAEAIGALKNGIIIWIDRPDDMIFDSIDIEKRPLIKSDPNSFFEISRQRRPIYESLCDYRFLNDKGEESAVNNILELIRKINIDD